MENQNVIRVDAQVMENDFMRRVYGWMGGGLSITAIVAFVVASNVTLISFIFDNTFVFLALVLLELGAVLYLSARIQKMSAQTASTVFIGYSILNGLTLSVIFLAYVGSSIASVFVVSAGMFIVVSFYGYTTKKDLTGVGQFAFMALIGIVLAMLVNIFIQNDMVGFVISCIAVIIFVALTAYDTQKIKTMYANMQVIGDETEKKTAIIGALKLYLDFINLFLNLLRIMGRRRS